MIDDEHSNLRKVARELYTTDIKPPTRRSVLHDEKIVASDSWKDDTSIASPTVVMQKPVKTTSFFKNMFFASLIFLFVAVVILGLSFVNGGNTVSEKNVDIAITTKAFVDGGESLPVDVTLVNKNKLGLELATLVLEYPQGNDDNSGTKGRIEREIGTLAAGASHQESFVIQLYGTQNSQRNITAHIEFRVQGSNAVYDKDQSTMVTIRTSPITITLAAPDKAIPNQEIPLKFTIIGNGTATLPNTAMVVQYPDGFTFNRAEPSPTFGSTVWYLGDVPPGVNRTITVYGSLAGSITDLKTIRASVGSQNASNEQLLDTTYNELAQVIPLSNAFLDASIAVANQTGATIPIASNQQVRVRIPFKNTLSVPLTNVQLAVSLSGSAYDPSLVEPISGFFDSVNNKILWTKQQDPSLDSINPGETGDVTFSIRPRILTGTSAATNPVIKVSLDVLGYQAGGTKLTAEGIDAKTFTVNSDLTLLARTIHYTGALENTGPMPPVPNKETTYTLELKITNTRNRVTGAVVTTTLPTYVTWKNVMLPQSESSNVSYNEVTRQLIWNVGDVPAGTGSTTGPRMLSLKVGITPSTQQSGGVPLLTDSIILTGKDAFTNQDLSITKLPLSTQLLNDGKGAGVDGAVGR